MYVIQHCFICCPSDSTVSEDVGIEPRTVAKMKLFQRILHAYDHHGVEGWDGGGEGLLGDVQVEGQLDDSQVLEEAPRVHIHPAQIKRDLHLELFGEFLWLRAMDEV